jgi:hypothetical protein
VPRADWTYELRPGAAEPKGIERYVVETADAERVGTVEGVVGRGDEVFLVVAHGAPPLHEYRALPWSAVAAVDGSEAAVRITLTAEEFGGSLELDPDRMVEGGPADAVRLTDVPGVVPEFVSPDALGPADRPALLLVSGAALIGALTLLGAAVVADAVGLIALPLFLVPAALIAFAIVMLFRMYRDPYARRRRPQGVRPAPPRR